MADEKEKAAHPATTGTVPDTSTTAAAAIIPSATSAMSSAEKGRASRRPASSPIEKPPWLGARPAVFRSTLHEVLFVFQATAAVMASSFLVGATTVVTLAIGRDLHMSQGEITWIAASTSLTAGAFQLALGQLADLLGRRSMLLAGTASFAGFAVVTGFARSPLWMDVLCGCMGVSSAMMVPPAIGILGAAYDRPSRRKNIVFSAFSAGNPVGFALGSILGGIAAQIFDWRAIFFLIAIIWGLLAVLAFFVVPSVEAFKGDEEVAAPQQQQPSLGEKLAGFFRTFDLVGAMLTLFGTGFVTSAITLAPHDGWTGSVVLGLLVSGALMLAVFVYWETIWPHPLMPPKIWKDRNFSLLIASLVFGFMAFNSAAFFLSLFMQEVQGWGALEVGVHLLPQAIAGLLWNIVAGALLHRVNNTLLQGIGAVSYLVANLLLALMSEELNYWAFVFPALVIQVIGADFQFNVVNMYVMQSLPSSQQALAGGIFNTVIRLCTTLALGISTAVHGSVPPEGPMGMGQMPKYRASFQVSVAFAAAGILCVPFIRLGTQGNEKPDKDEDVDSPGEEQALGESNGADVKTERR